MVRKRASEVALLIHETSQEVKDAMYDWSYDQIVWFRDWFRENKDSTNVPWYQAAPVEKKHDHSRR